MNKRHFIRNLTSLQTSWNISDKWSVTGSFQYTPSIPSLSSLTDYPQQTTPYLISNGNPDLKVAENFSYQIMPSFKYKKLSTSLLLTYRNVKNNVINDITYLGDKTFLSGSINAGKSNSFFSNLNIRLSDLYGFGFNTNISLDRYECAGTGWQHSLTSFSANMTIWWNKGPFTISYWRKIPGKYLYGHSVFKDENGDALNLEYKPDKHWMFSLGWMYMFDTKGTQYPQWNYSDVNPGFNERFIRNNGNMIVLSLSYTSDFGSIFRSGKRNLNNSDNGSSILKL